MGASSSCQIFEQLSVALQWIMQCKYKAGGMSHILDDFFFIGPADKFFVPLQKNWDTHKNGKNKTPYFQNYDLLDRN